MCTGKGSRWQYTRANAIMVNVQGQTRQSNRYSPGAAAWRLLGCGLLALSRGSSARPRLVGCGPAAAAHSVAACWPQHLGRRFLAAASWPQLLGRSFLAAASWPPVCAWSGAGSLAAHGWPRPLGCGLLAASRLRLVGGLSAAWLRQVAGRGPNRRRPICAD